jgi:hypothetical protein
VPPPTFGSLKKALPLSASPAAKARVNIRLEKTITNKAILNPFILFRLLSSSIYLFSHWSLSFSITIFQGPMAKPSLFAKNHVFNSIEIKYI